MANIRTLLMVSLVAGFFTVLGSCGNAAGPEPNPPPDTRPWKLAWSDEFDLANGSGPDAAKWTYDIGGGGWGNNELQTYIRADENVHIMNGMLVIQAHKVTYAAPDGITREYTSARLKTQGLHQWTYGKIEARIKLPRGQGIWPAFWMLGADMKEVDWPNCGEIDIMENIGREPSTVYGTIHGPGYSGGEGIGNAYTLAGGGRFADDFHVFAVEWEKTAIRFYVDGSLYATRTPSELPKGTSWVFDKPLFIILNLAVGGNWPGNPDATSVFPQTMLVDYVRAYQRGG